MKRFLTVVGLVAAGCGNGPTRPPAPGEVAVAADSWAIQCSAFQCSATATASNTGPGCVANVWGVAFAVTADGREVRTNGDDPSSGVPWYAAGVFAAGDDLVVEADGWERPEIAEAGVTFASRAFWNDVECPH